jgi:hypothetical protein
MPTARPEGAKADFNKIHRLWQAAGGISLMTLSRGCPPVRDQFEKSIHALAGSPTLIALVVFLFGLSAGLLEFLIHTAVAQAGISPREQAMISAVVVGFAAACAPLLALLAARERRRKLLDDLRKIAQLNHHVRNALQTIIYSEYLPSSEVKRQVIMEGADRIGRILQELFPAVGERVEDKRWKVIQINHVRAFVPDRRHRS